MSSEPQLHSSIVSMVSLAASIAAKHPSMGLCQLQRLRDMGVPQHQIDTVIEIARHIRNEGGEKLDEAFAAGSGQAVGDTAAQEPAGGSCCSTTDAGQSCC